MEERPISPCPECRKVPFMGGRHSEGLFRVLCLGNEGPDHFLVTKMHATRAAALREWETLVLEVKLKKDMEGEKP